MTKRILTAVKPTDRQMHIGNLLWAINPFIKMANENPNDEIFLFLANMHALTALHDWNAIKENSINVVKLYAACWADINRFYIYNPADIPGHAQLNRVFSCLTIMWTMERMHSYKEALEKWNAGTISVWTFNYPILMAADILLYDADYVPCGKDQKQHVEYARDFAEKFNREYGETFKIPEPLIDSRVATIIGSDWRKMSKSYNNYIWLLDDEKAVLKRVKQIPTSTQTVEEPKNPDECNVYQLCKLFLTEEEDKALREKYLAWGLSFKYAKDYLFEKIMSTITPIQKKYAEISDEEILKVLKRWKESVSPIAEKKVQEVYKKVWFILE